MPGSVLENSAGIHSNLSWEVAALVIIGPTFQLGKLRQREAK